MNYRDLLNIKYKYRKLVFLLIIILVIVFLRIKNKEIYDVYNSFGYIADSKLYVNIPFNYPDTISEFEYIKIDDEIVGEIASISELMVDQNTLVNYQIVEFALDKKYLENQVLNVSIYYNKQKVITKLKNLFV